MKLDSINFRVTGFVYLAIAGLFLVASLVIGNWLQQQSVEPGMSGLHPEVFNYVSHLPALYLLFGVFYSGVFGACLLLYHSQFPEFSSVRFLALYISAILFLAGIVAYDLSPLFEMLYPDDEQTGSEFGFIYYEPVGARLQVQMDAINAWLSLLLIIYGVFLLDLYLSYRRNSLSINSSVKLLSSILVLMFVSLAYMKVNFSVEFMQPIFWTIGSWFHA